MSQHRQQGTSLLLLVSIIIVSCGLIVTGQRTHTMTIDEANHLLRGVRPLQTGDFSLSYAHPPLSNLITAIPVAFTARRAFPHILHRPPENQEAHQLIAEEPGIFWFANIWLWKLLDHPEVQLRKARLMNLIFLLMIAIVSVAWSHAMWGWRSARRSL